ncbi:unnamed protein product [Rotaria sp. Silwood2]|nr:unnamed protein product [Rotaria sp. Silwood2]
MARCELYGARSAYYSSHEDHQSPIIISSSDPKKPSIKIGDIHIDSSSRIFDSQKSFVGLIIYSCKNKNEFKLGEVHCRTGDIYIKQSDWILCNIKKRSKHGDYVHGRLFFSIFKRWKEKKLEFVGAGFSYNDGQWKFNSNTLNTMNPNNDDTYHDTYKGLHPIEKRLIKRELTPEWVFELQEQFGEDLAKFQVEFGGISEELNKIKIGIKKAKEEIKSSNEIMASARARLRSANQLMASSNELMASSNELMASAKTHLASSNELVESSNARIESASLKKGLALEKMNEIEKKIDATKTIRAEIDNYWNDLINKEIEKRNKCHCTRS